MTKNKESDSEDQKEEEKDEETAESETEEEEEESEDTDKEEGSSESEEEEEEESSSEHSDKDERDYDAELEEEENKGKPAHEAFKKRKEKRDDGDDEDSRPMTVGEFKKLSNQSQKQALEAAALSFALGMTDNEKEARLVVAKWKNRTYPSDLSVKEQIEEAYVVTHRKNLIGQTNEAKRALRNKGKANDNAAGSHRDSPSNPSEPKLNPAEKQSLKAAGFEYNIKTKRYEKKLRGGVLVRDPRTKQAVFQRSK